MTFHAPNQYRVRSGRIGTDDDAGNNGLFFVNSRGVRGFTCPPLRAICSDGEGWEHVSVSLPDRCPTWPEMSIIKDLFWDPCDCVMQLHPPEEDYVNDHPFCLHLWRPIGQDIPRPPAIMVGYKPGAK